MPIATRIQQGHVLSAAFGILLLTITASGVISGSAVPALGWIGIHSVLLLIVYLIAMRIIYRYEAAQMRKLGDVAEELGTTKMSLRRAIVGYALNSVGLMAAAIWLPWLADGLAEMTGLGRTFVGTLFVATSTSLPEVVVSVTAARIGAVDMAAGNLFGSNLFNMFVIGLDDVLMVKGPMLGAVEPSHLIALGGAIGMTAIAIIGMTYRAASKRHRLSWDAVGMVLVYGLSALLLAQR
jgi:cation:H+ antiporter